MWHMSDGWGWWMSFGMLLMAALGIVVIWAMIALVRRPPDAPERTRLDHEPTARQILDQRYARGELTHEEFEDKRRRLVRSRGDLPEGATTPGRVADSA